MKIRTLFLVAIFAVFGMSLSLRAQEVSPSQGPLMGPSQVSSQGPSQGSAQGSAQGSSQDVGGLQLSPLDTQGIRRYLLGPGDTVSIRVWGQPDLSGDVDVDDQGNLSELHFLDKPIPAECRTEKEVARDIAKAYKKFIKNPQVSVRVTGRNSRPPAVIFGAVRMATRVQMQRRVRLQELITVSGGVTERANGDVQIMHTERAMCPEPGDVDEPSEIFAKDGTLQAPFMVYKIADLVAGKVQSNPLIRPGDIVLVMEAKPVYFTGALMAPQGLYLQNGMTLTRAIAMLGGVRKDARADDIRIYRITPGSSEQQIIKVSYTAIKKKQQEDILLQAYDVVDVPIAGDFSLKRIGQMLTQSVLGVGTGTFGGVLGNTVYRVIY